MATKRCTRCGSYRSLAGFQVRRASHDGLTASCKPCLGAYDKSRYQTQPQVRARHRRYAKTEAGRCAAIAAKAAWDRRNPRKRQASTAVGNAVRGGRLIKPDHCEACGVCPARLHGHHDDYAKPLDVRWLCPKCHSQWHQQNGEGMNA